MAGGAASSVLNGGEGRSPAPPVWGRSRPASAGKTWTHKWGLLDVTDAGSPFGREEGRLEPEDSLAEKRRPLGQGRQELLSRPGGSIGEAAWFRLGLWSRSCGIEPRVGLYAQRSVCLGLSPPSPNAAPALAGALPLPLPLPVFPERLARLENKAGVLTLITGCEPHNMVLKCVIFLFPIYGWGSGV